MPSGGRSDGAQFTLHKPNRQGFLSRIGLRISKHLQSHIDHASEIIRLLVETMWMSVVTAYKKY
jgi:hypothetical protein